MDHDEFNRSLDELLRQILAASEAGEEPADDPDDEDLPDFIADDIDPDVYVHIQREVTRAIRRLLPALHRHVVTTVQTRLDAYTEVVTSEVREVTTMYANSVTEGASELRAEIAKLRRMGLWLKWVVIVSWLLLLGTVVGSMGLFGAG